MLAYLPKDARENNFISWISKTKQYLLTKLYLLFRNNARGNFYVAFVAFLIFKRLHNDYGLTQEELGKIIGSAGYLLICQKQRR